MVIGLEISALIYLTGNDVLLAKLNKKEARNLHNLDVLNHIL